MFVIRVVERFVGLAVRDARRRIRQLEASVTLLESEIRVAAMKRRRR
jgi:hypothetical protein